MKVTVFAVQPPQIYSPDFDAFWGGLPPPLGGKSGPQPDPLGADTGFEQNRSVRIAAPW